MNCGPWEARAYILVLSEDSPVANLQPPIEGKYPS
jgi:hypothetical protein